MSKSQQEILLPSCVLLATAFAMMAGPDLCGIHTCLSPDSLGHSARLWPTPVLRRHAVACTVISLRWNPFSLAFIQPLIA